MSVVPISRGNVFRAVLCGVFAVVTLTAMESRAIAGVLKLKTVALNEACITFTYEYDGAPDAAFTMRLPGPTNDVDLAINGSGWSYTSVETVANGDGTYDAQIKNSAGATTGKLAVKVMADKHVIDSEMEKVYINLGALSDSPMSLPKYVKVTNRTGTTIPKGTVLQFLDQPSMFVSKLVDDLPPFPIMNADGKMGVAYCLVGVEQRVLIEKVSKNALDTWLPVAVSDKTVEFRMAETWSFKLKANCDCTVKYEFIDLRANFDPFPAGGGTVDNNAIVFDSTQGTNQNVLWSVSTIPVKVSDDATTKNRADFFNSFTNNTKTLYSAKNAQQMYANCGIDPYCNYGQLLDGAQFPLLKAKWSDFKESGPKGDELVKFLKGSKGWGTSSVSVDGSGLSVMSTPVNCNCGSPSAIFSSTPDVNIQVTPIPLQIIDIDSNSPQTSYETIIDMRPDTGVPSKAPATNGTAIPQLKTIAVPPTPIEIKK